MKDAPGETLLRQLARRATDRDRKDDEPEDAIEKPHLEAAQRPLDAAARARIVKHLETMILEERKTSKRETRERETAKRSENEAEDRSGLGRWLLPMAALLLIFLAVLAYRGHLLSGGGESAVAALPGYSLRVEGVAQPLRGGEAPRGPAAGNFRLTQGNRLRVTLTPERAAESPVSAYASIFDDGGERAVDAAFLHVSDRGAVRLDALLGSELIVLGNSARLLVVVGDEAALPEAARARAASAETGRADGEGWQAFALVLEIVDPP